MIRVEHISKHFGGIRAVDDVTLTIEKGSVTGLIGPNGAGKSTLFNLIAGLYRPTSGRIFLDGEEITEENRTPCSIRACCGLFRSHIHSPP